ncbi:MAG: hypothetical protein KTR29_15850 [Rhodothermaceae bacterium]|nr:hypothetical protein [Rhodothermaceae bacterium]
MNINVPVIPQHTIDTLAKGLYREAVQYGFEQKDILRFVNSLLQLSLKSTQQPAEHKELKEKEDQLVSCKEI